MTNTTDVDSARVDRLVLTPFQREFINLLTAAPNTAIGIAELCWKMKSNNLAVSSAARSLQRKGLIWITRSDDSQWSSSRFVLKRQNREFARHRHEWYYVDVDLSQNARS